jgi:hypothetical protein
VSSLPTTEKELIVNGPEASEGVNTQPPEDPETAVQPDGVYTPDPAFSRIPARDLFPGLTAEIASRKGLADRVHSDPPAAPQALPQCQLVDCTDVAAGRVDLDMAAYTGQRGSLFSLLICASHLRQVESGAIIGFGFTPEYTAVLMSPDPEA